MIDCWACSCHNCFLVLLRILAVLQNTPEGRLGSRGAPSYIASLASPRYSSCVVSSEAGDTVIQPRAVLRV